MVIYFQYIQTYTFICLPITQKKYEIVTVNAKSANELVIHADRASVGMVFYLLPVEIL